MKTIKLTLLSVLLTVSFNSFAGWNGKNYSLWTNGTNKVDAGTYMFSTVGVISTVTVSASTYFYGPMNVGDFAVSEGWAKLYEASYGPYATASTRSEVTWLGQGSTPSSMNNSDSKSSGTQIVNTVKYNVTLTSSPNIAAGFNISIK